MTDMSGHRALITGATGHLGKVIAETLVELGANLVLVDRPGSNFEKLERELLNIRKTNLISVVCDLENEIDRDSLVKKVKADGLGISCLINNAAFVGDSNIKGWATSFELQTTTSWRRAIEVNLTAAFHLCQSFASELQLSKKGSIINIGSIYGECGPDWSLYEGTSMGNPAAYAVSKGGLLQLTRWLATTMSPSVRVNAISPGGLLRNQSELFVQRYVKRTPLGRMANEADFRGAIIYLATDMSSYVTGQNLCVDGGWGVW